MSGQPVNSQSDINHYRNEFMETLALQSSINDVNLQANKNYLLSGVLPAVSQMKDTRTTAEKLADIEKLKQDIISGLANSGLFEPSAGAKMVEGLLNHTLNDDNRLLVFLAQNLDEIVKRLKPKYKYGIKGDENDIESFISNVNNLYILHKKQNLSVKNFLSGNYKVGTYEDPGIELDKIINSLISYRNFTTQPNTPEMIDSLVYGLRLIRVLFPTVGINEEIRQVLENPNNQDVGDFDDFENLKNYLYLQSQIKKILPPVNQVNFLIEEISRGRSTTDIIYKIADLFSSSLNFVNNYKIFLENIRRNPALLTVNRFSENVRNMRTPPQSREPTETLSSINSISSSSGNGIKKRIKKGGSIASRFVDFGTNEVNNQKLEDGVFSIRRKSKTNIMNLPSKLVSPSFQKIIKDIIGGKVPSYNDISSLNEEEQNYLHKVMKKSNLTDKFTVPTPSKDKIEKDIHSFNTMKGEILSGNDSKELVKKFKILVLKLSRLGMLPKHEANDVLLALVELNY